MSRRIVPDPVLGPPPTVSNISSSASNTTATTNVVRGQTISITITFSAPVAVTGTPLLALNSGGTASYVSGSGTTTLTFDYTPGASDAAKPLDASSTSALTLNGGTIRSATGVSATLTVPVGATTGALAANKNIEVAALVGGQWRWVAGTGLTDETPSHGSMGVADASNYPGARNDHAFTQDSSGNIWIFGGIGTDSTGATGVWLNDLWKFDGNNWTWMAGTNLGNQVGVYGTLGVADAANYPGGRAYGALWVDSNGIVWLYGGTGYDDSGLSGTPYLKDVWKFDGTAWTWVWGSSTAPGGGAVWNSHSYDGINDPGARPSPRPWLSLSDELFFFSGNVNSGGNNGNDIWSFNGSQWKWVAGTNSVGSPGPAATWGTLGVAAPGNIPQARRFGTSCTDSAGNFWTFGGSITNKLGDLWRYDGTDWTYMGGSQALDEAGVYGVQGTPSSANLPAGRSIANCVVDSNGKVWVFNGLTSAGSINDLWVFDSSDPTPANWTWAWMTGSSSANQTGTWGTRGTPSALVVYGARMNASTWIDNANRIWVYGGSGYDSAGASGNLGDIFRYDP